jgi:hypothetical protein
MTIGRQKVDGRQPEWEGNSQGPFTEKDDIRLEMFPNWLARFPSLRVAGAALDL